jgi:hypothetical protein
MRALASFFDEKARWSLETFGPGSRYSGVVAHIRKELVEIETKPADLVEWIDVVLLAMDGAWRAAGADGEAFCKALLDKDARNRQRQWPDWRTLAQGAVSEHVKSDEPTGDVTQRERALVLVGNNHPGRLLPARDMAIVDRLVASAGLMTEIVEIASIASTRQSQSELLMKLVELSRLGMHDHTNMVNYLDNLLEEEAAAASPTEAWVIAYRALP